MENAFVIFNFKDKREGQVWFAFELFEFRLKYNYTHT